MRADLRRRGLPPRPLRVALGLLSALAESSASHSRLPSLDAARGLAVLAMFVAHGYDGWVAPEHKLGLGYRVTREIAAAALPAFLFLAGMGLALRIARVRRASHATVREERAALVQRGVLLLGLGYALSLVYAVIDGGLVASTLLRADALHVIGASLALVAVVTLAPQRVLGLPIAGSPTTRSLVLALLVLGLTPWLTRLASQVDGALAYPLALLTHVEGITRFAVFPLCALCAAGTCFALSRPQVPTPRGALLLLGWALAASALLSLLTTFALEQLGGRLSPAHLAVYPNALDGCARALSVLALGTLAVHAAPRLLAEPLCALGRSSLWAYALHLPFCYGRLAAPLRARLDLGSATLALAVLTLVSAALAMRMRGHVGIPRAKAL